MRLKSNDEPLGKKSDVMRPVFVTSTDDNFALPATVMMRSVVDHLSGTQSADFFVLDCGMTDRSRSKMRRSIPGAWGRLHFVPIDEKALSGFRVDEHIPAAAYARLLMGKYLPSTVERVLYLDGDLVALTDVQPLWSTDLKGYPMAAVQDPAAGLVGQSAQMMHWEGWDIPVGTPIFNSGLMVIDLVRWRKERLFARAMQVAREHDDRMRWHDQDALNYVIRGEFEMLDPAWNLMTHLYYPPHRDTVVYDQSIVERCIREPKILHFCCDYRPWKGPGRHWREAEFYRYLYRTAWRNDVYCAPWMGRGNTLWTKMKHMVKQGL